MKLSIRLVSLMSLLAVMVAGMGSFFAHAQDPLYFPEPDLSNPAAPFIFTTDYAIQAGATAEWRKQEGVVIDAANKKLYMAITRMTDGMVDGAGDIQLSENPCGMVMVGDLDENWNLTELKPLIIGGPYDAATESCNPDNISEPDNVYADANGDLWIYEDTGLHLNNLAWKYEIATGTLKRFAAAPLGAEFTGLHILADGTLFLNVQHPDDTNAEPYNMGTVGVVTGFKATDSFEPIPMPEGDAQLMVTLAAGEYQILARSGDAFPASETLAGTPSTISGQPFEAAGICNNPDGNMFIPTSEDGSEAILFSNWECGPGGVSRLELKKEGDVWTVVAGSMVDFAEANGSLGNCNATVTPWNTGLTSEEEAPRDAAEWAEEYAPIMDVYMEGIANPYDFGYNIELIPTADGGTQTIKHYAMGRRENEQAWVAPDQQTVYIGDDGNNKIFYKFVAATAGDLSAGTLYAAKVTQTGTDNTADFAFQLEWIELGTSNNAEVEAAIRALDAK